MGDLGCSYQAAAIGAGVDDAGDMEEVGRRSSGHFTNTKVEKERRKNRNLKPLPCRPSFFFFILNGQTVVDNVNQNRLWKLFQHISYNTCKKFFYLFKNN